VIQAACRIYQYDISIDELECIAANLIVKRWMKGYIAHARCIVLSKLSPFPVH
jgi:hypothetical protein